MRESGLTLLETLCALMIGLFVVGASSTVMLWYRQTTLIAEEFATFQENGRAATYILRSSLERAGFIGCARLTQDFKLLHQGIDRVINFNRPLQVFQHDRLKTFFQAGYPVLKRSLIGTDSVFVWNMSPITYRVLKIHDRQIQISAKSVFERGEEVIIENCQKAIVLHILDVRNRGKIQEITVSHPVMLSQPVEIGLLKTSLFFVAKTTRRNKIGEPVPALYVRDESGQTRELIPDVVAFQVHCLAFQGRALGLQKSCDGIDDWHHIKALQLTLSFRSHDKINAGVRQRYLLQTWPLIILLKSNLS